MPSYSKEKQQEFIAKIRQIIVTKPNALGTEIKEALEQNGICLDINYIYRLLKKIHVERATRYDRATIRAALSTFEDFINATSAELLKISMTSKSDMVKVIALDNRVKHYSLLLEKLFDAGVFDRKLGVIEAKFTDVAKVLKLIKDERDNRRKLKSLGEADPGAGQNAGELPAVRP